MRTFADDSKMYLVPFVRKNNLTLFLKTIIPDRNATKKYLGGEKNGSVCGIMIW
ncbi:MAG: hypothetical protein HQL29_02450 [Candidatus Omnitrophica bacterium]|nr:hypothetical protein [Candidatus Omnitrophota bacterium]